MIFIRLYTMGQDHYYYNRFTVSWWFFLAAVHGLVIQYSVWYFIVNDWYSAMQAGDAYCSFWQFQGYFDQLCPPGSFEGDSDVNTVIVNPSSSFLQDNSLFVEEAILDNVGIDSQDSHHTNAFRAFNSKSFAQSGSQSTVQFYPASWESKAVIKVAATQEQYDAQDDIPTGIPDYTPMWLYSGCSIVATSIIVTIRLAAIAGNRNSGLYWTTMLIFAVLLFPLLFAMCEIPYVYNALGMSMMAGVEEKWNFKFMFRVLKRAVGARFWTKF
jgi:hypothetical protein